MPRVQARSERIEARIASDTLRVVRRAAEIKGRSLSEFIVTAAENEAYRTIEETQIVRLSVEDQAQFVDALLNPAEPVSAMRRAFEHRDALSGDS